MDLFTHQDWFTLKDELGQNTAPEYLDLSNRYIDYKYIDVIFAALRYSNQSVKRINLSNTGLNNFGLMFITGAMTRADSPDIDLIEIDLTNNPDCTDQDLIDKINAAVERNRAIAGAAIITNTSHSMTSTTKTLTSQTATSITTSTLTEASNLTDPDLPTMTDDAELEIEQVMNDGINNDDNDLNISAFPSLLATTPPPILVDDIHQIEVSHIAPYATTVSSLLPIITTASIDFAHNNDTNTSNTTGSKLPDKLQVHSEIAMWSLIIIGSIAFIALMVKCYYSRCRAKQLPDILFNTSVQSQENPMYFASAASVVVTSHSFDPNYEANAMAIYAVPYENSDNEQSHYLAPCAHYDGFSSDSGSDDDSQENTEQYETILEKNPSNYEQPCAHYDGFSSDEGSTHLDDNTDENGYQIPIESSNQHYATSNI
ncbi:hypothetical protein MMH89_02435 [Candidatus Comchoanobacter bicostacola]|uniref:Uncharacterized protein n=1 Tax=Candidatus Comchoanobacter bicostacola TaxID=2919598 RepID=A0ABY5DJG7_9GAMM|nr:hypothetical protein [Candidatus Comchoanobacter bicostacola]UTC24084.1 hypothetical protein MMH89_02435 [Candidatus Comchoanobacter bicostacola]